MKAELRFVHLLPSFSDINICISSFMCLFQEQILRGKKPYRIPKAAKKDPEPLYMIRLAEEQE
jgi:hypothetical protein